MPLDTLKWNKIEFGRVKKGLSFEEAFKDQTWTQRIVSSYEHSPNPAHRMYVRYVECMIEEQPMGAKTIGKPVDPAYCHEEALIEELEDELKELSSAYRVLAERMVTLEASLTEVLKKKKNQTRDGY
eukprot:Skav225201  [mRNA]  locus=scaffold1041:1171:1551:- [translate_table: standard]